MANSCVICRRQLSKTRCGNGQEKKIGTEALIFAAHEQALRTNYVKFNIDKSVDSPLCRLCGEKDEMINLIISECNKLAQKEYKRRHDNIARLVHWKLCCKYGIDRSEKWY